MSFPRIVFARNASKAATASLSSSVPSVITSKAPASTTSSVVVDANDKGVRALEHGRQRTRKAEDVAKLRARKAQNQSTHSAATTPSSGGGNRLSVPKRHSSASQPAMSDMDLKLSLMEGMEIVESFNCRPISPDWKVNGGEPRSPPLLGPQPELRAEVKLADLITPSTRKTRRRVDHDFEFVPHVRSVLVLEDTTSPELSFDEPWEHIYGEDDTKPGFKGPSYASVVAAQTAV